MRVYCEEEGNESAGYKAIGDGINYRDVDGILWNAQTYIWAIPKGENIPEGSLTLEGDPEEGHTYTQDTEIPQVDDPDYVPKVRTSQLGK